MAEYKPPFRQHDEHPKRDDDIHISTLWLKYDGNGRLFAQIMVSVGLMAIGCGSLVAIYMHDRNAAGNREAIVSTNAVEHAKVIEAISAQTNVVQHQTDAIREQTRLYGVQTCVFSLSMQERKQWRTDGRYCGDGTVFLRSH